MPGSLTASHLSAALWKETRGIFSQAGLDNLIIPCPLSLSRIHPGGSTFNTAQVSTTYKLLDKLVFLND